MKLKLTAKLTAGRAGILKSPGILGVALSGLASFGLVADAQAAELRISDESGKSLMVIDAPEGSSFRVEARGIDGKTSAALKKTVSLSPVASSSKLSSEFQSGVSVFNNIGTGEYVISTSDSSLKITSVDAIPSTDLVSGSGAAASDTSDVSSTSTSTKAAYVAGAAAVAGVIGAGVSSDSGIFSSSSRGDSSAREGSGSSSGSGTSYNPGVVEPRSGSGNVGALNNPSFDSNRPLPGSPAPQPSVIPTPRPAVIPLNSAATASPVPSANVQPAPSVVPTAAPPPPVTNPMTPS